MFCRSALGGAETHLCNLPDFGSFSFQIVEVFFLQLDIILAAFEGKQGWGEWAESPCSEMKTSRCLDCSWLEMNNFV